MHVLLLNTVYSNKLTSIIFNVSGTYHILTSINFNAFHISGLSIVVVGPPRGSCRVCFSTPKLAVQVMIAVLHYVE